MNVEVLGPGPGARDILRKSSKDHVCVGRVECVSHGDGGGSKEACGYFIDPVIYIKDWACKRHGPRPYAYVYLLLVAAGPALFVPLAVIEKPPAHPKWTLARTGAVTIK